jgi:hypothetical protein
MSLYFHGVHVHDGEMEPTHILFIGKFQFLGYVKSQNNRFSVLVHEVPLHDVKVGV